MNSVMFWDSGINMKLEMRGEGITNGALWPMEAIKQSRFAAIIPLHCRLITEQNWAGLASKKSRV